MRGLRSRLDRVWRMLMTGLCFALFGLGGLTLSLVWFNLLLIFQRDCGEVIVSAWKICGERKALRPLMTGVARRGEDSAQLDRK